MGALRPCVVCGTLAATARCPEHVRRRTGSTARTVHNRAYDVAAWRRVRTARLARHRRAHGDWCPGWGREPHPAADLTVDHIVPIAEGGAMYDAGNLAVLCRSCNGRKGARRG